MFDNVSPYTLKCERIERLRPFKSIISLAQGLIGLGISILLLGSSTAQAAPKRDLSLAVTATPDSVIVNGDLTFTLVATNAGQEDVKNVVLTDQLPLDVTFKSASSDCKFANKKAQRKNKLTCKAKRIPPGGNVVWSILVTPTQIGQLSNSATVKFGQRDATPLNNTATATVQILPPGNQPPSAAALSQTADPALPYLDLQLNGSDPDNDTLTYELVSPSNGTGYTLAYVNADTGKLYMSFTPGFEGQITLSYRVTDGNLFSPEAQIQIFVEPDTGDKGTGGKEIDPSLYANFDRARLASNLFGSPGTSPTEPPLVDLSSNFPTPGDQGQQGSCVGWATTYALKSYQEGVEMGWALNTPSRLFSPAYVYNQINGGQDGGSQIYDALDLIINQGAATLASMPYSDRDFTTQPNQTARNEAAKFKAVRRSTLNGISDIKGALAQRKPVVLGIEVFDQFYQLKGTNSVYNSTAGSNTGQHGRHAVTAVGYDNNHPSGGALRVINSWGTQWGDNGFFWLPYDMAPKVVFQAWTLEDGPNTDVPVNPDPPPPPPPPGNLPDLQVQSWNANLDFSIGGNGQLEWQVINSGQGDAPSGVTVSLLLSKDATINASDTYVVYEEIPFAMGTGDGAFRSINGGTGIPFQIPQTIEPGNYFMALAVDDLDRVAESDESNNISLSTGAVTLSDNQPDLVVEAWYADWNDFTGVGNLTYSIYNIGAQTAPAGWHLGLMLSPFDTPANAYILFEESVPFSLDVGAWVYRDSVSSATFNLYRDTLSRPIPAGVYYMILNADSKDQIAESNELNNESFSWGYITIGFGGQSNISATAQASKSANTSSYSAGNGTERRSVAYNGKRLPEKGIKVRQVRISDNLSGGRTLEFLDQADEPIEGLPNHDQSRKFHKTLHAHDRVVFPVRELLPMPAVPSQ
jgi:uncharacterized repeat protein (TIGR01451 family)